MTTVNAVYRGGVLCPTEPLPLAEGAEVRVTVEPQGALTEEEIIRRMKAAKNVQELFAAYELLPPVEGYDLIAALNENRILAGELPLSVPEDPEAGP
jgi:predicted DNA-binding antitoxin AbrB/MazE fold protein